MKLTTSNALAAAAALLVPQTLADCTWHKAGTTRLTRAVACKTPESWYLYTCPSGTISLPDEDLWVFQAKPNKDFTVHMKCQDADVVVHCTKGSRHEFDGVFGCKLSEEAWEVVEVPE